VFRAYSLLIHIVYVDRRSVYAFRRENPHNASLSDNFIFNTKSMPDLVYLVLFITFIIKNTSPILLSAILFPIFNWNWFAVVYSLRNIYGYSDVLGAPRVLPYRKPLKLMFCLHPKYAFSNVISTSFFYNRRFWLNTKIFGSPIPPPFPNPACGAVYWRTVTSSPPLHIAKLLHVVHAAAHP
jgi:hypothetical protein